MIWFLLMLVYPAQGEITNPSLEIIKGSKTLNAGSELQLKCNIRVDISGITFKWFKDDNPISAETSQMLTIISITKEQAGVYHCSAKNGTDVEEISSTKLTITVNSDRDECATTSGLCNGDKMQCVNTIGSYRCECMIGYLASTGSETTTCQDINECVLTPSICSGDKMECMNTMGSYTCTCMTGYAKSTGSGTTSCQDIDECVLTPSICSGDKIECMNTMGSYTCTCMTGYAKSTGSGTTSCQDVNECSSNSCSGTNVQCINTIGSFSCECLGGYQVSSGTGTSALQCVVKLGVFVTITPTIEGKDMIITCNVTGGGQTKSISWKNNNIIMDEQINRTIVEQSVQRSIIGTNYTCIATDSLGVQEATATVSKDDIYYLDKPKINFIEDTSSPVNENGNVIMKCQSHSQNSQLTLSYKWVKETSDTTTNISTNQTVRLISIKRESAGTYKCKVEGKNGNIVLSNESSMAIKVFYKASGLLFTPSDKNEGKVGEAFSMICYTNNYGNPPAILAWYRSDVKLPTGKQDEQVSYTIDPIRRDSTGNYTCIAKNTAGEINKTFTFTATDKPDPPTFQFPSSTSTSITVSITPPTHTGNKPILYYTLQYQGGGKNISKNITDSTNPVYPITELKPAVKYQVRVKAVNVIGAGPFSKFISATTGDAPPSIPREFVHDTISRPQEITLSWLKPNPSNGLITNYKFCYIQDTNDGVKMENSVENCTDVVNVTTFTLKGLGFYNGYNVSVSARNSAGFGSNATLHQILTGEGVPTKPRQFGHDTISQPQEITFSWKKPIPSNGFITNYILCYIQDTNDGLKVENSVENCTDVGTVTIFTLKGLGLYNGYNVSVRARNSAAFGPNAGQHQIVTLEGVPNEVRIVSSTIKKKSISVTWKRPKHINGMLHGYTVKYRLSSENAETDVNECINITKLSCTVYDLQPFRNYTVIIIVFNRLFSRSTSIITQTLADAPPPLDKDLPDPPADRIEETSFAINILKFKETNGKIVHYDVIAMKRTNSLYSEKPQDIKNNDIKTFVVGRLYKVVDNQLFIVGGGQKSKRKRRALGIPNNSELEEDTTYVVFVRAYVNDNLYQSTSWYTPVKTAESKTDVAMVVGVVVGILIAICLIIIIILFVRSRRSSNGDVEMKEKKRKNAQDQLSNDRDPRIPVATSCFEGHVNMLKANSNYEFSQEYSMISRELVHSYNQSRSEENNIKNRYHNVPSYDDTRVMLSIVDDDPHSDFINANFISGFERENEYIAAQGPLPETLFDFWRMVWENDVTSILMLTQLEERGRIKCAQYWPDNSSLTLKDIVITATEVLDFPDHVVRTFHVTRTGQAIERIVKQFHFTAWPDFGVPDDPLALLSFLRKVNNWKGMSQGPIIVHCSAGVGRTGTYITIDTQIKNIKKYKEISIFTNVSNIREQRCLMVQTEDQYIFIHLALLDYLESGDTEIEANALREHVKKLSEVDTRTGMTALMDEFVKLAKTHKRENFQEANKSSNQAKNRFRTLYPFDDTRVKLTQRPGVDGSDYINANYIDSYATKNYFIATQAPLENTVGDFWRMIWEQNCATIVMLTNEEKDEKVKVHPYWPPVTSLKSDAFIVELGSVTTYGDHIVRELKLTNTDASTSRDVKQFHYTSWPETGSPLSGTGMIELIGQVQKWNSSIDNKIITVHCSAGVGRTGVFIALTNLIERVKTEGVIDLYQTVKKMRQQRPGMVQTPDQYEFCFQALQEYLDSFDLYSNFR